MANLPSRRLRSSHAIARCRISSLILSLGLVALLLPACLGLLEAVRGIRGGTTTVGRLGRAVGPVVVMLAGASLLIALAVGPMAGRRTALAVILDGLLVAGVVTVLIVAGGLVGVGVWRMAGRRGAGSMERAARLGAVLVVGYVWVLGRVASALSAR